MWNYKNQLMFRQTSDNDKVITYIVKPGDSLYLIANAYNTTIESIINLNNLTSTTIYIDQILIIPQYTEVIVINTSEKVFSHQSEASKVIAVMNKFARLPVIETFPFWFKVKLFNGHFGFIKRASVYFATYDGSIPILQIVGYYTLQESPVLPSSFNSFYNNTGLISQLPLFMFRFNKDNPSEIEKFGLFSDEDINLIFSLGHSYNIKVLPVIHNLLYKPGGQKVGKEVSKKLLSSLSNRSKAIQNIIGVIEKYGFDGVNIDIEDVYIEDSKNLSAFYKELGIALSKEGYFYSVSIPSRTSDKPYNPFSAPFDYKEIGSYVDQFIVMLYNEHGWPGSGPGPVVSSGWMEEVLKFALKKMPRKKIVAALSVFGFDFNLETGKTTYVTYDMATSLAKNYTSKEVFDPKTMTPMFSYTDQSGAKHEVWFDNANSILAKSELAWQLGIEGIALWRLGMEDPSLWSLLAKNIVVKKSFYPLANHQ